MTDADPPPFYAAHIFVCTNRRYIETAVYDSGDPFAWTEEQRIATIPAHAAEVIETLDGELFISSCGWGMGGVYLASLEIAP